MIPKQIFTTYLGLKGKLPHEFFSQDTKHLFDKCLESWHKYAPDYKVTIISQDNMFDAGYDAFMEELFNRGYGIGQWCQLKFLYEFGGIYMDTDYELIKPLEPLIEQDLAFLGHQGLSYRTKRGIVCTSIQGCYPFDPLVSELLEVHKNSNFNDPHSGGPELYSNVLEKHGWNREDTYQKVNTTTIYPSEVFFPYSWEIKPRPEYITDKTVGIHHWNCSWSQKSDIHGKLDK